MGLSEWQTNPFKRRFCMGVAFGERRGGRGETVSNAGNAQIAGECDVAAAVRVKHVRLGAERCNHAALDHLDVRVHR